MRHIVAHEASICKEMGAVQGLRFRIASCKVWVKAEGICNPDCSMQHAVGEQFADDRLLTGGICQAPSQGSQGA